MSVQNNVLEDFNQQQLPQPVCLDENELFFFLCKNN